MKVLIVDDSRAMRMIVRRTLRQAGVQATEVSESCNGAEAFGMAIDSNPDLILCDWNMPEMSGLDLLRKLREAGNRTNFGFVTSESTEEMRTRAMEAGARFLITKPFTTESFEDALKPVLRESRNGRPC